MPVNPSVDCHVVASRTASVADAWSTFGVTGVAGVTAGCELTQQTPTIATGGGFDLAAGDVTTGVQVHNAGSADIYYTLNPALIAGAANLGIRVPAGSTDVLNVQGCGVTSGSVTPPGPKVFVRAPGGATSVTVTVATVKA